MGLDPAIRAEVDAVFRDDAPARLARLADALERLASGDEEDARSAAAYEAHTLRGGAATAGRRELAELCATVERAVTNDAAAPSDLRTFAARLRSARTAITGSPERRGIFTRHLPRRFMTRLSLILALTLVPALGVAAYNTFSTVGRSRTLIRRDVVTEASLASQVARALQQSARSELSAAAENSEVGSGSAHACSALFDRLVAASPRFASFAVVDGDGRIACGSRGAAKVFASDASLTRQAVSSGRFTVGPLQRDGRRWLVAFAAPLPGNPGAAIATAVPARALDSVLSAVTLQAEGSVVVFDRRGVIIARRPDPDGRFVGMRTQVAAAARLHPGPGTTETAGVDGVARLFAYRPAGPWYAAVGSALAPGELHRLHTLLVSFLVVAILGLAGILVGLAAARRALGRPLASLVETARRLGHGDLSARTDPGVRGAELGELAAALDTMAERVAKDAAERDRANERLETLAADLELLVEARTAALEEAWQASERHSEAKSGFLARLSHELRTPLNAIRGFSQLLVAEDLSGDQAEAAQQVAAASEHMTHLVDELLDDARIEAGEFRVELTVVGARDLVAEVIALQHGVAADSGISLEVADVADVAVEADPGRLLQVLLNLVSNGIAYNRPGGRVTLAVRAVDEAKVAFEVEDTGPGIPAEQLDRLFVAYDRLDRGPESSGLGLGLALSRRLVEAMHGSIEVESHVGRGTRFVVTLPRARASAETAKGTKDAKPSVPARAASRTVVYVDDNATNVRLVELLLRSRNVDVVSAASAADGFAAAEASLPGLILLDLELPDGSGEELLRRFRADDRFRAVPIVIVSGDAARETVRRLLEAGADDYLTKPIEVDRAAELIMRLLAR
jgi:signal transduction histidine kinase/HPt (histidine-containing phosphotransfer) domain-containing protein